MYQSIKVVEVPLTLSWLLQKCNGMNFFHHFLTLSFSFFVLSLSFLFSFLSPSFFAHHWFEEWEHDSSSLHTEHDDHHHEDTFELKKERKKEGNKRNWEKKEKEIGREKKSILCESEYENGDDRRCEKGEVSSKILFSFFFFSFFLFLPLNVILKERKERERDDGEKESRNDDDATRWWFLFSLSLFLLFFLFPITFSPLLPPLKFSLSHF